MKIDSFGCVVMERDGMPGDIGDSCAETGRLVLLRNTLLFPDVPSQKILFLNLDRFISPSGFLRHPEAPVGWREDDFTSDQMTYLLMASFIHNLELFNFIVNNLHLMTKYKTPDVRAIAHRAWNTLGVITCVQMLINKFPYRWADGGEADGHWYSKFWRFTRSNDSTVSYLTVFIAVLFLKRVGVTWPLKFLNFELYLQKAKAYYSGQPNSDWFTKLFDTALI